MPDFYHKAIRWILAVFAILATVELQAQVQIIDYEILPAPDNEFTIDAKLNTRGELRIGGFDPEEEEEGKDLRAQFIMGQYRI
ncbi:MAG: hypothetical protein IKH15_00455, partial [Bacteroidales bacterium]|nr:hypothetical protein [Bacteroidales bacterium]